MLGGSRKIKVGRCGIPHFDLGLMLSGLVCESIHDKLGV